MPRLFDHQLPPLRAAYIPADVGGAGHYKSDDDYEDLDPPVKFFGLIKIVGNILQLYTAIQTEQLSIKLLRVDGCSVTDSLFKNTSLFCIY